MTSERRRARLERRATDQAVPAGPAAPEHLRKFNAAEWLDPGQTVHVPPPGQPPVPAERYQTYYLALTRWRMARRAYRAEHGRGSMMPRWW